MSKYEDWDRLEQRDYLVDWMECVTEAILVGDTDNPSMKIRYFDKDGVHEYISEDGELFSAIEGAIVKQNIEWDDN